MDRLLRAISFTGDAMYTCRYWLAYFGLIALAVWGCYRLLDFVGALD